MSRVQLLRRFFSFQPLLGGLLVVYMANLLSGCILTEDTASQGETVTARDGTKLTLELANADTGQIVRSVDSFTTSKLKATLVTPGNVSRENVIISFSSSLGTITPDSKTALTNSNGVAAVNLTAEDKGGAGSVSASVQTQTASLTVTYNFTVIENGAGGNGGTGDLTGSDAPTDGSGDPVTQDPAPEAAIIGTIEFVDAEPSLMAIKGTGGQGLSESSVVTFRVIDENGQPLSDKLVNFELNSDVGGLRVYPTSRVTDSRGYVSTFVYSGTVATSVRVTASSVVTATDGNSYTVSSQSDKLVVSSGLPDQDSFTLALSTYNVEGADFLGREVSVTAQLADQFNNFVPDATAVYFTSEGGSIEPYCFTHRGKCTVKWVSGNPIPSDHRVTIMAATIGNESFIDVDSNGYYNDADGEPFKDGNGNNRFDEPFTDTNGNGIFDEPFTDASGDGNYDPGEVFVDYNNNGVYDGNANNPAGETTFVDSNGDGEYDGSGFYPAGDTYTDVNGNGLFDGPGFIDVAEVYLDENENDQYDTGEYFIDSNGNGIFDSSGDGKFTGNICQSGSNCSTDKTIYISNSAILVTSGSHARIALVDANTGTIYASNYLVADTNTINIRDSSVTLDMTIEDSAGQVMPEGTVVTLVVGDSVTADIYDDVRESFVVKNTHNLAETTFRAVLADEFISHDEVSSLKIKVVTPSNEETSMVINLIE